MDSSVQTLHFFRITIYRAGEPSWRTHLVGAPANRMGDLVWTHGQGQTRSHKPVGLWLVVSPVASAWSGPAWSRPCRLVWHRSLQGDSMPWAHHLGAGAGWVWFPLREPTRGIGPSTRPGVLPCPTCTSKVWTSWVQTLLFLLTHQHESFGLAAPQLGGGLRLGTLARTPWVQTRGPPVTLAGSGPC